MSGYIGAQPVPQATQHREAFTATASQTSFPTVGYTPQFVDVYLNGVKLAAADYTATNGSDIVLTTGAALNDILEYVAYTPFEVASQTFTGTTTVSDLAATGTVTAGDVNVISASATPLHVDRNVSSGAATIQVSNSTHTTYFGTRSGGGFAIDDDADLSLGPWLVIDTAGQVGIGTTTPSAALDVAGDIVVSGGVYLGGSAAANKLDDYEEGTWTPTVVSGTITTSSACTYTKTGRLVHLTGANLIFSDYTSTATLQIENLPFTPSTGSMTGSVMAQHRDNNIGLTAFTSNSTAAVKFYYSSSTIAFSPARHNMFNNASGNIYFSIAYLTDA